MKAGYVALLALGYAGCTLDAGQGFATLEAGELRTTLANAERTEAAGEAEVTTDRGYSVRLKVVRVTVGALELLGTGGEGVSGEAEGDEHEHDHGDEHEHDHGHDEAAVEEADTDDGVVAIVSMPLDAELDVLAGNRVAIDHFDPSAELPPTTLTEAELSIERLELEATVSGGDLPDERELSADLELDQHLHTELATVIDRDGPETLSPRGILRFDAQILDGLELGELLPEAGEPLPADGAIAERLADWVAETPFALAL